MNKEEFEELIKSVEDAAIRSYPKWVERLKELDKEAAEFDRKQRLGMNACLNKTYNI